ncbi:MAG: hypothetical protein KBB54_02775 [Candidatus Pacebacteria bacterium]|nr:hypothetical protein [Candidatus Paceibacterota bacterium]MBP9818602.1 hypothetical protein [Candidatus Paceibacterota bacterium]
MKKLLNISIAIASIIAIAIVAVTAGTAGMEKVEAAGESTYFVDITGNGCGNNCADFYRYLTANGISVTSTNNQNTSTSNTSNTNNGSTTTATSTRPTTAPTASTSIPNYVQYPYQVYTNFPSTDAYRKATSTNSTNYVPYPYYGYSYFQNPAPKYDPATSGQYPEQVYIYHGTDATAQMNKYKKTYVPVSSTNGYSSNGLSASRDSGFTITSILN